MSTATVTPIDPDTGRDPRTEKWLDAHGIPFRFEPRWPLADIDVPRSLANQARIGDPLDAEVVDQYENDYRNGDAFPPLVLHLPSPQARKAVTLGGNHRTAGASKAGLSHHPAYVVTGLDPDVALKVSYADNRTHGARLTRQDRMRQAAHLVATGSSQKEAAAVVGISQADVSRAISIAEGSKRAAVEGLASVWDQLPHGHQVILAVIRLDVAFAEALRVVADAKLTQPEVRQLANAVNGARTEEKALQILGSAREEHAGAIQVRLGKGAAQRHGPTEYGSVNAAVSAILNADPSRVYLSAPSPADRRRMKARLRDAMLNAKRIADAL